MNFWCSEAEQVIGEYCIGLLMSYFSKTESLWTLYSISTTKSLDNLLLLDRGYPFWESRRRLLCGKLVGLSAVESFGERVVLETVFIPDTPVGSKLLANTGSNPLGYHLHRQVTQNVIQHIHDNLFGPPANSRSRTSLLGIPENAHIRKACWPGNRGLFLRTCDTGDRSDL